ncbi:hypothetical protein FB567DRAFT_79863 [Paraphoma chrysanthemicola]|uniref:Uncharacterized protein n=1 Tax=Paraphoma chrysanthemicola TaxID=798071 RepID=A0A8K0R3X6_9PLEO|nr:hypothetical protein FB567DRAFT_79863 [Paraphoma chrysanthemicola]
MEESPRGIGLPPHILIFSARIDGERAESNLEVLTTTKPVVKYNELEDLVYGHFGRDRSAFLLHFHTERLELCASKLRPLSFDQGRYFYEAVLIDGALRLVPHFVTIKEHVRKRMLIRDTDDSASTSKPQKRRIEVVKPSETTSADTDLENKRTPPFQKLDRPEVNEGQTKLRSSGQLGFDHGTFRRQATSKLPPDATCSSFMKDFEAEKQRYISTRDLGAYSTLSKSQKGLVTLGAHMVLIKGKYGMDALMPCDLCVRDGLVCHVYHSDCFEWDIAGKDAYFMLGWRCGQCRANRAIDRGGGCNAQHGH